MDKDRKITDKTNREYDNILGVGVDSTTQDRVIRFFREKIANKEQFSVFTPNPEIVLEAVNNKYFLKVLNSGSLLVCDGVGLLAARAFLSLPRVSNKLIGAVGYFFQGLYVGLKLFLGLMDMTKLIKGRDLFISLCALGNKLGWKVFLLGGKADQACQAKEALEKNYKGLQIACFAGPILNVLAEPATEKDARLLKEAVDRINAFSPHLLFVGFNAPKQELWINKHLPELKTFGAMAVGGTFDYVSGRVKRVPKWLEIINLEWLFRLVQEPWRLKRIVNAVIVFPFKVYLQKLS